MWDFIQKRVSPALLYAKTWRPFYFGYWHMPSATLMRKCLKLEGETREVTWILVAITEKIPMKLWRNSEWVYHCPLCPFATQTVSRRYTIFDTDRSRRKGINFRVGGGDWKACLLSTKTAWVATELNPSVRIKNQAGDALCRLETRAADQPTLEEENPKTFDIRFPHKEIQRKWWEVQEGKSVLFLCRAQRRKSNLKFCLWKCLCIAKKEWIGGQKNCSLLKHCEWTGDRPTIPSKGIVHQTLKFAPPASLQRWARSRIHSWMGIKTAVLTSIGQRSIYLEH